MTAPEILVGDCLTLMPTLPAASVDAIVTDPPYGLSFMGQDWDHGVPGAHYWVEALRVAKPGTHLLAFGGTRTYHRLACAIEDAGWQIRDCLGWLYGSGFPKSRDALKPAWEPILLARKPCCGSVAANVAAYGTGAPQIEACRIAYQSTDDFDLTRSKANPNGGNKPSSGDVYHEGRFHQHPQHRIEAAGRWPANLVLDEAAAALLDAQSGVTEAGVERLPRGSGGMWSGVSNTPCEPQYGDVGGASRFFYVAKASRAEREAGLDTIPPTLVGRSHGAQLAVARGEVQGSSEAFNGTRHRRNTHPTVKPVALMRWLCRLITPPGGLILDPFAGSGSTGVAAVLEHCRFLGIEIGPAYAAIARERIALAASQRSLFDVPPENLA